MHHAAGTADAEDALWQAGQGTAHRDEAILLLIDACHTNAHVRETPVQPALQLLVRDGRPRHQRGLFQEHQLFRKWHGIEEARQLAASHGASTLSTPETGRYGLLRGMLGWGFL